ncbi:MAG TPA: hypothetical protein VFV33_24870, partial [Gemmatimonadaceae bacterium]|nr:hypothetical protein [Gemmatimonadaceae bacterium]
MGAIVVGGAVLARGLPAQGRPASRAPAREATSRPAPAFDRALAVATADSAWARIAHTYYDTTFRGADWGAVGRTVRERAARASDMPGVRAAIREMFSVLGESHFALIPVDAVEGGADATVPDAAAGEVGMEFRLLEGAIVV